MVQRWLVGLWFSTDSWLMIQHWLMPMLQFWLMPMVRCWLVAYVSALANAYGSALSVGLWFSAV
jgi:hypothetical protein